MFKSIVSVSIFWTVLGALVGGAAVAFEDHRIMLAAFLFFFALALALEFIVDNAATKVIKAIREMKDEVVAAVEVPESQREEERQEREFEEQMEEEKMREKQKEEHP